MISIANNLYGILLMKLQSDLNKALRGTVCEYTKTRLENTVLIELETNIGQFELYDHLHFN
jgi:hypothetical protein